MLTILNKSFINSSKPNCLSFNFCSFVKISLGGNFGIFLTPLDSSCFLSWTKSLYLLCITHVLYGVYNFISYKAKFFLNNLMVSSTIVYEVINAEISI